MKLSKQLLEQLTQFLDENYIEDYPLKPRRSIFCHREADVCESYAPLPCAPKAASLEDMLKQEDAGFTETLLKLIDQRGKKDSEVYKKANLSKQHFSKIRNNPHYRPTKSTAIALALALELDLEGTRDLIGRAGYALSNSSKFDLIIRFFIEQGNYNVVEINMALYEFDQALLGS